MDETLVIGFGYKARNGKDTAAKAIIEQRGNPQIEDGVQRFDIRRFSFGDELKREVNDAAEKAGGMYELIASMRVSHNLPLWVQYEINADTSDPMCPFGKQRTLLQWWGTEYRRNQDLFYWVKKTALRIQQEKPKVALVTDVRFPNEFLWVKATGGFTVQVERHGYLQNHNSQHESEKALDGWKFDYHILVEDGNVEELKRDAVTVFDMIYESMNPPVTDFSVGDEDAPKSGLLVQP